MRRTGNTSFSPTIGIVTAGTSKIGFAPACASVELVVVTTPANASAPDASMVLRSTVSMDCSALLLIDLLAEVSSARFRGGQGRSRSGQGQTGRKKARDEAGLWFVDDHSSPL